MINLDVELSVRIYPSTLLRTNGSFNFCRIYAFIQTSFSMLDVLINSCLLITKILALYTNQSCFPFALSKSAGRIEWASSNGDLKFYSPRSFKNALLFGLRPRNSTSISSGSFSPPCAKIVLA